MCLQADPVREFLSMMFYNFTLPFQKWRFQRYTPDYNKETVNTQKESFPDLLSEIIRNVKQNQINQIETTGKTERVINIFYSRCLPWTSVTGEFCEQINLNHLMGALIFRSVCQEFCPREGGGRAWLLGGCMVAGGHAWLLGGVHGCRGHAWVAGGHA